MKRASRGFSRRARIGLARRVTRRHAPVPSIAQMADRAGVTAAVLYTDPIPALDALPWLEPARDEESGRTMGYL